jgi:hypothetical protein
MNRRVVAVSLALVAASCGGGGDGGTPPVTVAAVAIAAPAAPVVFGAVGRTLLLSAQALTASGAPIPTAAIGWTSSNPAAASVSASGLVTALADGATQITASSGGQTSPPLAITVRQVPVALTLSPSPLVFGALGSTRQMTAVLRDSLGAPSATPPAVWSGTARGTLSISASGLVTSLAVSPPGQADSIQASVTLGNATFTTPMPVLVNQLVATVAITATSPGPDTLFTTGRQRQFAANPRDSNGNVMAVPVAWGQSGAAAIAVDGNGLATAVTDGIANVTATAGGRVGTRPLVVRRFAATFTLAPASAAISTANGTAGFTASALDSAGTALVTNWVSRNTSLMTVLPAQGPSTTVTAVGNGSTLLVVSGGTRSDSASLTLSNQPFVSFAAQVQPIFNTSCALAGCHNVPGGAGNLNLSAGAARTQLVGVTANGFPGAVRVIAGDAAASYLTRKLEGGPNITGGQMPDGALPLPVATIRIIKDWINQGANNN